MSLFPSWPFGKVAAVRHRENAPRTVCPACKGTGELNGCPCPGGCDGRGWFDEHNPAPAERK